MAEFLDRDYWIIINGVGEILGTVETRKGKVSLGEILQSYKEHHPDAHVLKVTQVEKDLAYNNHGRNWNKIKKG